MSLEKNQIFDELDRINASEEFRGKPVMMKLLSYLVTECVEGRSDLIKGYSVGLDVFGQGSGFDPSSSAIVRNNAVRLRGLLKTYYLGAGERDPVIIDLPKGRYVPQFRVNETENADASLSRRPAIAVAPFRNLSSNTDFEFLATGLSQALSEALTKFDDLRVIGINRLDRPDALVGELRKKGVNFVIHGEVQAADSQIKVSFRLVDTNGNIQVWADSVRFDLEKDNVFDVEERITLRVASLIGGEYGHINQLRFQSLQQGWPKTLDEQTVLLKHYHHATVLTEQSMLEFAALANEALEENPESALIDAVVGGFYGNIWAFGGEGADEALSELARLAEKAYTLNPNSQYVLGTLGFKCFVFDERDRLFALFDKHEDLIPHSPLRLGAWATYISLMGEWDRGKQLLDQVFENNLNVPAWLYGVSFLYHFRDGDYEAALVEVNKYQMPGLFWGPAYRVAVLAHLGRIAEAEAEFKALLEYRPDFVENGRRLMGCLIKEASLLEHLVEGFDKIGVQLA